MKKNLERLWILLLDVLFACAYFVAIGFGALVVHKFTEFLEQWGMPSVLVQGMHFVGYVLWVVDALLVLWLVGVATIKCARDAFKD